MIYVVLLQYGADSSTEHNVYEDTSTPEAALLHLKTYYN